MQLIAKSAEEVKFFINDTARFMGVGVTPVHSGAIVGWLNKYLGGDENRHIVLGWLFNKKDAVSIHNINDAELFALSVWIDATKDNSGQWNPQACFAAEAALVLTEAIRWYNAIKKSDRQMPLLLTESPVVDQVANCGAVITKITDDDSEVVTDKPENFPTPALIRSASEPTGGAVVLETAPKIEKKKPEDKYARARRLING